MDAADTVDDPHLRARGFFRLNGSDEVGWHDYPSHLWHWDGPTMRHEGLCAFGAANDAVWRDVVGLDDETITKLRDGGHLLDHFIDGAGKPL